MKAIFYSDDNCIYALNADDTVTKIYERHDYGIKAVFPSSSNPKDIKSAVFSCGNDFIKCGNWLNTSELSCFYNDSVVRVYKDIFLAHDNEKLSWSLIRVVHNESPHEQSNEDSVDTE